MITTLLESMRDAEWNLEDFVTEVNRLLPTVLSGEYGDARQREDFTVRLLRHYASLGLLDEAAKVGREARYGYRHLLQVLCLRRLQRQGWNSKAIAVFCQNDTPQLEAFLQPEPAAPDTRLEEKSQATPSKKSAVPQGSALEFLQQLRSKVVVPAAAPAAPPPKSQQWQRIELTPGLELHVSEDLNLGDQERQDVEQHISRILKKP